MLYIWQQFWALGMLIPQLPKCFHVGRNTMKDHKINKGLCVLNLIIIIFLLIDTFYLPYKKQKETVSNIETHFPKTLDGDISYTLHSKLNNQYRINSRLHDIMSPRDTFVVYKTAIIRKPVEIEYINKLNVTYFVMGILNNFFCRLLLVYIIVVSASLLIKYNIVKDVNYRERFIFSSSMITFILVVFYLCD